MKLAFIRYSKIIFIYLRLHKLLNPFSSLFLNLYCMTKLSDLVARSKPEVHNDFPSKWDYQKRYQLYKRVIEKEGLAGEAINYMEFGVAAGHSFRFFLQENQNPQSRFYGFDTFTGLPEDWGPFKKGSFSNENQIPVIQDERGKFYQGLFQQTIHRFLPELDNSRRNVLMLDADIYSATLYALTSLAPFLKKGDLIFFDEFAVPTHEFKAFLDFVQAYYINLEMIAAANNYYFSIFKVV
ncbi:class I SAM-dependent methyltransferase [Flavisolibacter nicotianae]|uniref:class I SAM-dependent methyltransferase n=1 Tax=Flavisolibacter nicotianae TaxID=2364882 RepID=UPI000EB2155B|nr:class I SAM-dependent methyltransferase [Flavisolibacter nicotianae]